MTDDELFFLDASEIARLLHARKVSPVELTRSMLERIARVDPHLGAFARITPELALAQARDAEKLLMQRRVLGPLHGVPIAVKDLCWTQGVPTAAGMTIYQDFYGYAGGIYRHVTGAAAGGHCVCLVGYDDAQGFWIAKNSWSSGFGEQGFFRIAYGECALESWSVQGTSGVSLPS